MKAAIILKNSDLTNFNKDDFDIVIGADRGAYVAIKNNIILDISIGDFDSVNNEEFDLIKNNSKKIIKLNPIKDESDTHEAIELVKNYDKIIIFGGIKGNRIEHLFANIIDLMNYNNVSLIDSNSLIEIINDNNYEINLNYKFISLYSLVNESIISLDGFKYNLNEYHLKYNDSLCLSNEIINNPKINLIKGKLLIIYSHGD